MQAENLYPRIRENIKFHVAPSVVEIYDPYQQTEFKLAEEAWEVYQKCNGAKNIIQIANELSEEWEVETAEILEFLIDAAKRGYVAFSETPKEEKINVIGSREEYFPKNVSFELTTTCNILCTFCYGCYGPAKKEHFPVEKIPWFFEKLTSHGVISIEITGGEPLAHPKFTDIYRLAFQKFDSVALISNGILWKPEHFEIVESNKHKAFIQISLHGSNDETNALVRLKKNTFDKTLRTIKKLVEIGVRHRVNYVVTHENKHDLKNTAQLMREIGVKAFSISIPDSVGRGSELTYSDGKALNNYSSPYSKELTDLVAEVNVEYKDIIYNLSTLKEQHEKLFPGEDILKNSTNCGAGHRSVAIRANGNVTGCPIMEEGVAHIGNVFENDLVTLFNDPKSKMMREFFKNQNDPSCMHCEYNAFCASCMVHIYQANKERLAKGKGLCGVVRRTGMDKVFNFEYDAKSHVGGFVQITRNY